MIVAAIQQAGKNGEVMRVIKDHDGASMHARLL